MTENASKPIDLFENPHVGAALYFTDQAQFIWKARMQGGGFSIKTLAEPEVCAAFTQKGFDTGWLPRGIIRMGTGMHGRWYVYFEEPSWKTITIEEVGKLLVPLPAMLMISVSKQFYLAALKSVVPGRFDLIQATCEVPLPNVHARTGQICWGSNPMPSGDPRQAENAWKAFIESPFNRDLANKKSKQYPLNVIELLKTLDMEKDFPVDDLVKRSANVKEWVAKTIGEDLE